MQLTVSSRNCPSASTPPIGSSHQRRIDVIGALIVPAPLYTQFCLPPSLRRAIIVVVQFLHGGTAVMSVQWLLSWWNLIFILPFALALFYLGVYTVSGLTFGGGEADVHGDFADGSADAGADLHADADLQHDLPLDADADADGHGATAEHADGSAETDADSGRPIHLTILSWLGI